MKRAQLAQIIADRMERRYARLVGRGTTAEYVILRALRSAGVQAVALPDMICIAMLEGALLAGVRPLFADVNSERLSLSFDALPRLPPTHAVLYTHLFGFRVNPSAYSNLNHNGNITIEDAVQGIGGEGVGKQGQVSFLGFDDNKMIGGRGGAILTDDPALWELIDAVDLADPMVPAIDGVAPSPFLGAYTRQILPTRNDLIRPFDDRTSNIDRILNGWRSLPARVQPRNENATHLAFLLDGLPLQLPAVLPGDAVWRYPIIAHDSLTARWICRYLQAAGLRGSTLYTPLSTLFEVENNLRMPLGSTSLAGRVVNLWVDENLDEATIKRTAQVIQQTPFR